MAEQELMFDGIENLEPVNDAVIPTMDEAGKTDSVQYWWLNIVHNTWPLEGDSIGTKKTINFNLVRRRNNDDVENRFKHWLDCYLIDRKDNPHFGQPIAYQELAISLLDYCGIPVNNENVNLAYSSIRNNLDQYIRKSDFVCNPSIVLTTSRQLKNGYLTGKAWQYRRGKDGSIPERPKGKRILRTIQHSQKIFYFYRKDEVPQFSLSKEHIGDPNYVQPANDVDPEKNYPPITDIYPFSIARKGDVVFACDTKIQCIIAKLKIESIDKNKVCFEIISIYNPICPIRWLKEPYSKFCGDEPLEIFRIADTDAAEIMKRIEKRIGPKAELRITKYSEEKLKNEFIDKKTVEAILEACRIKKNVILQGAPGVGKSYLAKLIAYAMMKEQDDSRICYIQFHPNYAYEDFIIGYKPNENGVFEPQEGVFLKFCEMASIHDTKDYFFIIDEINRGNLSKICGEAFTLIDKDHRDEYIKLASFNIPMKVPRNMHIIGLMNTVDRSLAMMDMALRRRFAFFTLTPGFETKSFKLYQKKLNSPIFDKLIEKIIELNNFIKDKDSSLDEGFCIGHSYFCNLENVDATELKGILKGIVEYEINPMLREYWFDDIDGQYKVQSEKILSVFE
jgi:MoxR-like ATPase